MNFVRTLSFRRAIVAVAALVVGAVGQAKADIALDDFSTPTPFESYSIPPQPNPTVITNALTGATRTITLSVTSSTTPGPNALTGTVGGGFFSAAFDVNSAGTVSIAYAFDSALNFIPNVPAGGTVGNLQFVGAGDAGFGDNISVDITVNTATGDLTGTTTLPLTSTLSPVNLSLSGLTGTGDLSAVTGLTLNMAAGQAADLIFSSLAVTTPDAPPPTNDVPAPPAVFLALAALPILGLRKKLMKKA